MENTNKVYYNKEGWVCGRYPYDIEIENHERYIEVNSEDYGKTLGTECHFAWRVVEGKLVNERFEETPENEQLENLRALREELCFPIINRGQAWHDRLTPKQKQELATWYKGWLDATKTKVEPRTPSWLFIENKEVEHGTN
jgi:hypothetical protein